MPKLNITLEERIYERVSMVPFAGCWLWMLKLNEDGYGRMCSGSRQRYAHIVTFENFRGPVPDGMELDHLCRVRCCVNPWHLEPVTHAENVRRGVDVGKFGADLMRSKTHCPSGHEYSEENTRRYGNQRKCKRCNTIKHLEYWHRRGKYLKQVDR